MLLASRRAVGRAAALTTSGEDLREEGREEEAVGVSRLLHARASSCGLRVGDWLIPAKPIQNAGGLQTRKRLNDAIFAEDGDFRDRVEAGEQRAGSIVVLDRKSVWAGKRVSVRVDLGGGRRI